MPQVGCSYATDSEKVMDFKIVDANGKLIETARNAVEAKAKMRAGRERHGRQVLLDDTGVEISESELEVLCEAEQASLR
jgi:mevalonate kinase